jgi:hypothetical protein
MTHSVPVKFELYDILKDPGQTRDLSRESPEVLKRMSDMMTTQWLDIRKEYIELTGIK